LVRKTYFWRTAAAFFKVISNLEEVCMLFD
jgi:hypothetical protein